ncbi:MAG TPA: hypothetical protein VGC09_12730 [Rhodopila sp.]
MGIAWVAAMTPQRIADDAPLDRRRHDSLADSKDCTYTITNRSIGVAGSLQRQLGVRMRLTRINPAGLLANTRMGLT